MFSILDVTCNGVTIPSAIPQLTSMVVTFIKIVVPIILIVLGMIDLGKAVAASKEEEIKKAQTLFIKRFIAAIIVFLIVTIVQVFFNVMAQTGVVDEGTWVDCISPFLNGE